MRWEPARYWNGHLPRQAWRCRGRSSSAQSYAAALALLAKTDTLGLLIPPMLEEPYGQRQLRQIKIQETLPAAVIGMYARADAPFTPAAASMAQAVTATARRIARGR